MMNNTANKELLDHDTYLKEREMLYTNRHSNYDSYDKAILTLSASFLAFSLSFMEFVKKGAQTSCQLLIDNKGMLFLSWICFASSVIITLLNFLVSVLSYDREIDKLEEAVREDVTALEKKNLWVHLSNLNYVLSGICFVAGTAFLILFCWKNFSVSK